MEMRDLESDSLLCRNNKTNPRGYRGKLSKPQKDKCQQFSFLWKLETSLSMK